MKLIITESFFDFLTEATSEEIHAKYYSGIPIDIFNQLISSDPTTVNNKMGKYSKWILNLYNKKMLKLEDLYKVKEYLEYYHKFINKIQEKDINKIPSLPDLYTIISPFQSNPNQSSSKSDEVRKIKEDAEKVFEDNEWLVIVPKTKEASCYYGKNTQWCTAAAKNNMFDEYNDYGKLYININKKTNEKYQFHFESYSFMDETDEQLPKPIPRAIDMSDGLLEFYKKNIEHTFFLKLLVNKLDRIKSDEEVLRNRFVGVLDYTAKILLDENYKEISKEYKEIGNFYDNISIVSDVQDSLGLIDINGKELVVPKYREIDYSMYGGNYIGLNDFRHNSYSIYDMNKNEIVANINGIKIYSSYLIGDNFYSSTTIDGAYLFSIYSISQNKFLTDYVFNTIPFNKKGPKTCEMYDREKHQFVATVEVQQNGDYKIVEE